MIDIPNTTGLILSSSLIVLGLYFAGYAIAGFVRGTVRVADDSSERSGADAASVSVVWLMCATVLLGGGLVGLSYALMRQWHW